MSSNRQVMVWLVSLALVGGLLNACDSKQPPDVSSISAKPSTEILLGETAGVSVQASGENLAFEWTAERGTVSSKGGPSAMYTAPDSPGPDTVTVEVSSSGGTMYRNITFDVRQPPTDTPPPTDIPTPVPTTPPTEMPTPSSTPTPTPAPPPPPPLIEVFPQADDGDAFVYTNEGGEVDARYVESERCRHSGPYGLRITYEMEGPASGGWGVHWAGTPAKSADLSGFSELTFWVRGTAGGETFQVGIKDTSTNEIKVESADLVVVSGSNWQQVSLALTEFSEKGVNLASVENINLGFNRDHGSGTICIDDIALQ